MHRCSVGHKRVTGFQKSIRPDFQISVKLNDNPTFNSLVIVNELAGTVQYG
jgi:hypothetical protein